MKVTAFIGNVRKKYTYDATVQLLEKLRSHGDIEYEIVMLGDYRLGICRGCKQCFEKGEECCPLKDDRDVLLEKINSSDGIVLASPNYSFNVSGLMKVFLDRLGFIFHRPCFFGKAYTSVVVQGIYRGKEISKYFNFIGNGLGFTVVNGCCLTAIEPMTEKDRKTFDRVLDRLSGKFHAALARKKYPAPGLFKLFIFRYARTSMKLLLDDRSRDYAYYKKNGWFESEYYYPIQLNPFKKLAGRLFDRMTVLTTQTDRQS